MRKVVFGVANSLDNFIARKDGGIDWLLWNDELTASMKDFWKTIDTVLMGRKTYEVGRKHGSVSYLGITTYVFSRTLKETDDEGVHLISDDACEFLRKLKESGGKDIRAMGGGIFAKPLLEADLIDEIALNIHPILLGSGIPLFLEMKRQINLQLIESRTLKTNCVLLTYKVKREAA